MKLSTLSSLFVLLSVVSMIAIAPSAFADVTVTNAAGSSTPGCEPDCFIPSTVTIEVGETVTWDNTDGTAAHTATAGTAADGPSGVWDSSLIMAVEVIPILPTLQEHSITFVWFIHGWREL